MTNTAWALARHPRSWAAALLAMLVATAGVAAPVYQVVDLGSLRGKTDSGPTALNAQGVVVGYATARKDYTHPVLFGKRKPLDLIGTTGVDALVGYSQSINSAGDIAGSLLMSGGRWKPFVYRQGTMEVVEAPGYVDSRVYGLSDLGHLLVTGYLNSNSISSVRQPDGTWVTLTRWNDSYEMVGKAIDRQGVVVGYARKDYEFSQAVVWRNNKPQPVPGTEGDSLSVATAVNDRGDVAGEHSAVWGNQVGSRAFVVRDSVLTNVTGRNLFSEATGLNNLGHVVGNAYTPGSSVPTAFLFQDGETMFLNDLVEPAQQGQWQILSACAINDAGEIAATGRSTIAGIERALKLVPVTTR